MSTTRWIKWCEEHARGSANCCRRVEGDVGGCQHREPCRMVKRTVVDPDNLPPEAIQRAAGELAKLRGCDGPGNSGTPCATCLAEAEAAITAFLSDAEPGDQT